jgi:outer membrane protein OmpA-like peptidoglycan-associated protein
MIKRILLIILIGATIKASAQLSLPTFEVGTGLVLRHSEGFYIPRISVAGHKIYKGLGLYLTYEQRNNVPFADDFNADGNYQRYLVGPTFNINRFVYLFGGISPIGSYGLEGEGGFGKVRKEIGIAGVWKNYTMNFGYSNWVGATVGVGYQFGIKLPKKPSVPKVPVLEPVKREEPVQREEPIQETPKPVEPVSEVAPVEPIVVEESVTKDPILLAVVRFEFNSIVLTPKSRVELDALVTTYKAKYNKKDLVIVGHTDPKGSDEVNDRIGLQRAQVVAKYLEVNYGIQNVKIVVRSEGERKIISTEDSVNRRSEVYVIL